MPTYNERDNLPALVQRLFALEVAVDLLVVDDNSPDGTGQLADQLVQENASIHVLHPSQKRGLGQAYLAGFQWALARDYEFVFELDGDGSHNPDDIPRLIAAARGADLVLGSRYLGGIRIINWPLRRLILSKGASLYVRLATGMPFTDPTGGFKCFRRQALQALDLEAVQSNGYSFQIEITHKLWRQGLKIVEVPIVFTDRIQGHSKMSGQIVREAVWIVWRLWFLNLLRRRPAAPAVHPPPRQPKPAERPESAGRTGEPSRNLPGIPSMNDPAPSLLPRLAYGLLAIVVAGLIISDFNHARNRVPAHGGKMLPMVTLEPALSGDAQGEIRARGSFWLLVQGLSATEILPEEHRLWRHGTAPATVVIVEPRQEAARMRYAFDNSVPNQTLTIRIAGREVAVRGPLREEHVTGEFEVPASTEELRVELAFSGWRQPLPDPRKITVTFSELTLLLP